MKLNICLSKLNEFGALARLENDDMDSLDIAKTSNNRDARKICVTAAKKLRSLADKFDVLAEEPEPFKEATHERVNRMGVKRPNEKAHR